ncbi:MAG: hypothetical protein WC273_10070 [Dehalococcoidia bacterium]
MAPAGPSIPGLLAAALSGAVAVWYLALIAQGAVGTRGAEVWVASVALLLFAQAGLAAAGAIRRSAPLVAAASALLLVTGVLGLFSIGAPLLLAAVIAAGAAAREWVRSR